MRKNCQIWNKNNVLNEFYPYPDRKDMCYGDYEILNDGSFRIKLEVEGELKEVVYSPMEIAEKVDMPLWEIVMVDYDGSDEFALLFYEEG